MRRCADKPEDVLVVTHVRRVLEYQVAEVSRLEHLYLNKAQAQQDCEAKFSKKKKDPLMAGGTCFLFGFATMLGMAFAFLFFLFMATVRTVVSHHE